MLVVFEHSSEMLVYLAGFGRMVAYKKNRGSAPAVLHVVQPFFLRLHVVLVEHQRVLSFFENGKIEY